MGRLVGNSVDVSAKLHLVNSCAFKSLGSSCSPGRRAVFSIVGWTVTLGFGEAFNFLAVMCFVPCSYHLFKLISQCGIKLNCLCGSTACNNSTWYSNLAEVLCCSHSWVMLWSFRGASVLLLFMHFCKVLSLSLMGSSWQSRPISVFKHFCLWVCLISISIFLLLLSNLLQAKNICSVSGCFNPLTALTDLCHTLSCVATEKQL